MDVRERLVELIADHCDMKDKRCIGCEKGLPEAVECKNSRFGKVADHLIANGVMVSPCKVGQTVYYLFQYSNKRILPFVRKAKVKRIYCGNPKMEFLVDCELKDTQEKGIIRTWYFDDFGKTVFLTKEEAEAHLPQLPKGE